MADALDLIAVGNVSVDTIKIDGTGQRTVPGGSAAAVLTSASSYGASTGVVTRIGKDYKQNWINELDERGIDLTGVSTQKTSCRFELNYDKTGKLTKFSEIFTVDDALAKKDFPNTYKNARHIHLSASHPRHQVKFLQFPNPGSTISLTLWPTYESEYDQEFAKLLKNVDVLFCNNHEVKLLSNKENVYDGVKEIAKLGPKIVVLTKGAKGSAMHHDDHFHLYPSLRSSKIDATGCGDAFAGGFLAEYLKSGDAEKAGGVGAAMASFTLSKMGSWFPREITQRQIEERIERAKKYSEKNVKKGTLLDFF
jgi:sugar/nucleoside kinase (ribokinase family)